MPIPIKCNSNMLTIIYKTNWFLLPSLRSAGRFLISFSSS